MTWMQDFLSCQLEIIIGKIHKVFIIKINNFIIYNNLLIDDDNIWAENIYMVVLAS